VPHHAGFSGRPGYLGAPQRAALTLRSRLLLLFLLFLTRPVNAATPVDVGYRDFDFGTAVTSTPTGEKPESKLWWTDGFWWGVLWNPASSSYEIHRFDLSSHNWISTGTPVDPRASAKVDALWDGQRLYVATHIFTLNPGATTAGNSARLYRYSYNATQNTYSLDSGFPVTINGSKSETLVLDKDSTGKLWITWIEGKRVKVNRSTGSDLTWGTPFDLPVQGNNTDVDDISSLVAFGGNKIGILWSNQADDRMYFAAHLDGNGDTSWQPREEAVPDASSGADADDHINLKFSCAGDGALYGVVKTGLGVDAPLNYVVKRSPAGVWSRHVVGLGIDNHTRPIMLIDSDANRAYVFAMSDKTGRYVIYMKSASLNDLAFSPGLGTVFIDSPQDIKLNNPTSTKQCVGGATGILVLASDQDTHYYLHNYLNLGGVSAPTITAFNPASGPGGTVVTVDGSGFSSATAVKFNGTPAAGFTIESGGRLRATVPSAATSGPISVTNSAGTATSAASFTVVAPPTISAFAPTSGPAATVVTVDGSNFSSATAVKFNGTAAAGFTIESATRLRATVPAGATTGPISVTNPAGTATSAASFTVIAAPAISGFTPASGPVGIVVTVDGSNFANASAVKFNGTSASFTIESATRLRATVPAGASSGPISVTNPAGTGTSTASFTVIAPPTVTTFTPASGPVGTFVAVDGTSFTTASAVKFNGTAATFVVESATRVRATVPASATSGPISVTNPAGTGTSAASFTVIGPPTISSFAPASGPVGTVVTVNGLSFTTASAVKFNGTSAAFTIESNTRLRATVPAGASSGAISVTNPAGTGTSAASFTVIAPPTISAFTPTYGVPSTVVTIYGTGFATASAVRFNGASANFTVENATRLRATVPLGATSGPISVTNPAGTATSAQNFDPLGYRVAATPEITFFDPSSGPVAIQVTIDGNGFATASAVKFNGTAAAFTVESDARLRATVPIGATSGRISVTAAGGTGTSASNFNVVQPVAVGDEDVPGEFTLRSSFPNPFTARTSIRFELPRSGSARLYVYDLVGRTVKKLVEGEVVSGAHEISWDGRDNAGALVSPGVYLLDLRAEGYRATRRLLRMR
jgi:IPT/TIG domain-containing protein/flagellar hook capping protein FlgD